MMDASDVLYPICLLSFLCKNTGVEHFEALIKIEAPVLESFRPCPI